MKTLTTILILICLSSFIKGGTRRGEDLPSQPDSVIIELDLRITYCDSMAADAMNKIIQVPDEKKLKELSQQARDWSIRRDCFIESKQVYILKKEKHNVK